MTADLSTSNHAIGNGSAGNHSDDYDDSGEDDYEDEDDERMNNRRMFPYFTPVTPYPPVYCMSTELICFLSILFPIIPSFYSASIENNCRNGSGVTRS